MVVISVACGVCICSFSCVCFFIVVRFWVLIFVVCVGESSCVSFRFFLGFDVIATSPIVCRVCFATVYALGFFLAFFRTIARQMFPRTFHTTGLQSAVVLGVVVPLAPFALWCAFRFSPRFNGHYAVLQFVEFENFV